MAEVPAPPESIARAPASAPIAAPAAQSTTQLLSPVDSKFYSVPSSQVDAYLQAGYARPFARDLAHERLLKQYSGWDSTLKATGLGFLHGVPLFDTALTSLQADGGKAYAEASRNLAEANPFASGVGQLAGGVGGVALAAAAPELLAGGLGEAGAVGAAGEAMAGAPTAAGAVEAAAAPVSRAAQAGQFALEAGKSGAINVAAGAAGQIDEHALNHALDPEGQEKLQMSMGGLLADFALGIGGHAVVSGAGAIFKGAAHGLEHVAESIRGKTAEAEEAAAAVNRETSVLDNAAQPISTPPVVPSTETNLAGAPPDAGVSDIGPKPLSAAAQRIEDIKAAQAQVESTPIDPSENPSVRAQRLKELQAELDHHQSMSEDEIVAAHGDPKDIAAAEAADQEIGPLHNQEYGEEAFDRLEPIKHLASKEQRAHLDSEINEIKTSFRQAESEGEAADRGLSKVRSTEMEKELAAALGPQNSAVFKEHVEPYFRHPVEVKELKRLKSDYDKGKPKTNDQKYEDRKEAAKMESSPGAIKMSLRTHRNLMQALSDKIGWDHATSTPSNDALKKGYQVLRSYLPEHFKESGKGKIKPGEITAAQFADLNKRYSTATLAKRAISQPGSADGAYARIVEQSRAAHEADVARLEKGVDRFKVQVDKEAERATKAQERIKETQGKRLLAAEQAKAREDYADAVKKRAALAKEQKAAERLVEAQKAKAAAHEKRVTRLKEAEVRRNELKAEREKDRAIQQQQLNEAKFGHVVQAGILGAISHGMKGSMTGMALSGGMALLRGIPKAKWAQVGDKLAVLFRGVDKKLARTVEAGLYGIPAEVHRALDPNDYPAQAAKVMAARNGPQNAYTNIARAHLENDMPDELAVPMTQQGWAALQAIGAAMPQTGGPPGVYSQQEPDLHQKLVWMGQLATAKDPSWGIANPSPENISILKAYFPQMLYNSQQAAALEVQQNPDLPLEGKLYASALCERPLTVLASNQFLSTLAGARQQSAQQSATQNSPNPGNAPSRKVQSSMSRMDSLQNQDA